MLGNEGTIVSEWRGGGCGGGGGGGGGGNGGLGGGEQEQVGGRKNEGRRGEDDGRVVREWRRGAFRMCLCMLCVAVCV